MGPTPSTQVLERRYLFPRKLSLLALALTSLLVAGTALLVAYMHRSFADVHREQLPLLEMASINVRLANSIELQSAFALREPKAALLDDLGSNLDSLDYNLKAFREALARNPSLRPADGEAEAFLRSRRALLERLQHARLADARALQGGEEFRKQGEAFLTALADSTETLSQSRDERLARQVRLERGLAFAFLVFGAFLAALFARIYLAYRANFERRLEAEAQVLLLSRQRQQLIHVLCHDLGNPVSSIAGLIGYVEKFEGEPRAQAIAMIRSSAANAQGIIELIRKLQALETGKLSLEMEPQPLAELLRESLGVLRERLAMKRIEAVVDVPDGTRVLVERTSFVSSVVNNVLTNAIKFSKEGSKIEIRARREGGHVLLTVRDHGVGMPPALVDSVFSETKATSRTGTSGEAGTGFGMPLVKKFVIAYGGTIEVVSSEAEIDHGTEIRMRFKEAA